MGALVVSTSNIGDSSVGGKNNNRGSVGFQGSIQEGETLHVEHMDFIDEKDTRDNICLAFFSPIGHFLVNLVSYFLFDFTGVTSKQSQKSLASRINNINFVETHSVNHFFSFLDFTFGALHVTGLRTHGIIISGSAKRTSDLGNSS